MPKLPNSVEVESAPPAATLLQQLLHLSRVGARLSAFECLLAYVLPAAYLGCTQELPWLAWNAAGQILLFVPLVIVPALRTSQMWYVDIGWPLGLVLLGANAVLYAPGLWLRRCLMGGCVMLHGARPWLPTVAFTGCWPLLSVLGCVLTACGRGAYKLGQVGRRLVVPAPGVAWLG